MPLSPDEKARNPKNLKSWSLNEKVRLQGSSPAVGTSDGVGCGRLLLLSYTVGSLR